MFGEEIEKDLEDVEGEMMESEKQLKARMSIMP